MDFFDGHHHHDVLLDWVSVSFALLYDELLYCHFISSRKALSRMQLAALRSHLSICSVFVRILSSFDITSIRSTADALQPSPARRPIRLVTWNLLAPIYAPPSKYPWSDPAALEWTNHRQPRIIQTIQESQADIVCLQEVQMDLWEDFYRNGLESNYTAVVQNMTCEHPVGCAVLFRKDRNWQVVDTESRSRALIVILEERQQQQTDDGCASLLPQKLYLTVVHLEAGYEKEETRWNQIRSLFKRLHHHVEDEEDPCVILAGDFNTWERLSPLFSVLSGTEYKGRQKISSWKGLSHFLNAGGDLSNAPPWKSLLPLVNVHEDNRPTLTYAGGSVLDYIWVSPSSIKVHESLVIWSPDEFEAYKKEDYDEELRPPQPWPSADHPSDHVPIGVDFSLR